MNATGKSGYAALVQLCWSESAPGKCRRVHWHAMAVLAPLRMGVPLRIIGDCSMEYSSPLTRRT